MKHQLSQQEIDSLFNSAPDRHVEAGAIPFDFGRMDRLPKAQVGTIHHLQDAFVRALTSSLTVYLRSVVTGSLISVEQLAYADFAETMAVPTCLVYLSMQPYEGHALVEVSPSLISPILDLVLGGNGTITSEIKRELTEMEKSLLEAFFQILVHDLHDAWKIIVDIAFAPSSIETRPQLSGRFVPTETVIAVAMEFRIGQATGMLNLALPSITLKSMGNKFEQQTGSRRTENPETEQAIKSKLSREFEVTVDCEFSGQTIAMRDFLNLTVGDIFTVGPTIEEPVDILVNGVPKRRGYLAASPRNSRTVVLE